MTGNPQRSVQKLTQEQEAAISRAVNLLAAKPGCIVGQVGRDYAARAMRSLLRDLGVAKDAEEV